MGTWADEVARIFRRWDADCVVAESNMGGDMVEMAIRAVDETIPVRLVHASKGKRARAEPVHMLYEQGRVKHEGRGLRALEEELKQLGTYKSYHQSPDRADALVWGVWHLLIDAEPRYRIRGLW